MVVGNSGKARYRVHTGCYSYFGPFICTNATSSCSFSPTTISHHGRSFHTPLAETEHNVRGIEVRWTLPHSFRFINPTGTTSLVMVVACLVRLVTFFGGQTPAYFKGLLDTTRSVDSPPGRICNFDHPQNLSQGEFWHGKIGISPC